MTKSVSPTVTAKKKPAPDMARRLSMLMATLQERAKDRAQAMKPVVGQEVEVVTVSSELLEGMVGCRGTIVRFVGKDKRVPIINVVGHGETVGSLIGWKRLTEDEQHGTLTIVSPE